MAVALMLRMEGREGEGKGWLRRRSRQGKKGDQGYLVFERTSTVASAWLAST
jgi:hypothetical protein